VTEARRPSRGRDRAVIAIDGPSGAGKGTIARAVAKALGFRHVDTGAMYRAVAWKARRDDVPLDDEARMAELAAAARLVAADGVVTVDGIDVAIDIRTPEIDRAAAATARLPAVREVLVARQRLEADEGGLVMEGRDIGTVVFPNADVKLYLDASPEERARRRAADPAHSSGRHRTALAQVANEMNERDRLDSTRDASPLQQAGDAIHVDTTGKAVEQVLDEILAIIRERLT
jgi:CMP/dCMP kinase